MIIFLGNGHSLKLYSNVIEQYKDTTPDIVVSCQYPHKVPESLLNSHTCINIHYGTLPFYAGCNPIYWQIMKDDCAGVTLHYMDKNWDSGDVIDIRQIPIGDMTADELYESLAVVGLDLFKKYLPMILNGNAPRKKQDINYRRYYPKSLLDFNKEKYCSATDDKKVRAVHFKDKQLPIIKIGNREYEISCRNTGI